MNGNQTAALAFNYMIEARKAKGIAQAERHGGKNNCNNRHD